MRRMLRLLVVPVFVLGAAGAARATDIPIIGYKLTVVDKLVASSTARVVFVSKDTAITYGTGTGPEQIEANLGIAYDSTSGSFEMPAGIGWIVNNGAIAKYVNKEAPTGGAVKVGILKPASLVKMTGKSLGDTPLDISSAPSGSVYVVATVVNGAETTRLCTQFTGCLYHVIAAGTGYKLVCRGNSTGDPGCTAAVPPLPWTFAAEVAPLLSAKCSACHGGPATPQYNGLSNLQDPSLAYANTVNVSSTEVPTLKRVLPGDHTLSYLWHKVNGSQLSVGGSGSQMPQGGPFLSQTELDGLAGWIDAGAMNN